MGINAKHRLQQRRLQHLQVAAGHGDLDLDFHHLLRLLLVVLALLSTGQLSLLFGEDTAYELMVMVLTLIMAHYSWADLPIGLPGKIRTQNR
nr:hypothetical protein [Pseudomonas migulae]